MVAVGDVYELVAEWIDSTGVTRTINVFHFRQKAGFLSAINLIGEFRSGIESQYKALVASGIAIRRYAARSMIPYNTDFYETVLTPTIPGNTGVQSMPLVAAGVITWRTGQPGRRKRGRTYIAGISYEQQSGGRLSSTYLATTFNNFGTQMISRWGPGGLSATTEVGVWSRLNGNQDPPHDPAGFTPITSFTCQPALGSMGTRRWGRGM